MQLGGIHHLTAISAKPRDNLAFYTGLLGMRLVKKTEIATDRPGFATPAKRSRVIARSDLSAVAQRAKAEATKQSNFAASTLDWLKSSCPAMPVCLAQTA